MTDERHDVEAACLHAQRHPRPNGVLPHYTRCDWVKGQGWELDRCKLPAEHPGAHEYL